MSINKKDKIHGYSISELANISFNVNPSKELKEKFIERTKKHIALVNYFAQKLGLSFPDHDRSKLGGLLDGYCYYIKPKDELTEEEKELLDIVTYVHITQSPHHPEYWTDSSLSGFTRNNPTPNGIIDATDMPIDSLVEMACDWCAMSKEFNNSPFEWLQRVNGVRWLFTEDQLTVLRKTLKKLWEDELE